MLSRFVEKQVARLALLGALLLAGGVACSEKGSSLVLLALEAPPSLTSLATVNVQVRKDAPNGSVLADKTFPWKANMVNRVGVYLPKSVSGAVAVVVVGYDAMDARVAMVISSAAITVAPGAATAELPLQLAPTGEPPAGDGGAGDGSTGGAGTGGAAPGTGGISVNTGGAGGTATGGAGPGTGGAAATGGRGGGSGGAANTGGAAGGAGGAAVPMWRGNKIVDPDLLVPSYTPAVAVDSAGNAVVVYRHGTGIRASRYVAASDSWSAPVGVETRSGGQAYSPAIGVDKTGTWLVIWQQDPNMSLKGLWQSTSTDGTTWTAPTAITTNPAYTPVLAVNKDGAAVAAWYGRDPTEGNFPCSASVRTAGAWSAPTVMKPANTANGYPEQTVAITGSGEAYVVWQDVDDGTARQNSIYMRRYSAGAWSAATLVESYDGGGSDTQTVAANAAGQVIIAWRQTSNSVDEMWARRYTTGGAATAPVLLGQGAWISWDPHASATIDDSGVSTVAWTFEVQGKFNVYASRAAHNQPFPADPTAIETDNLAAAMDNSLTESAKAAPVLGSDGSGNVVVVWRKSNGTRFDLYGRRFSGGVWGTPALLEDQNTNSTFYPVLGVGPNGTAVAAWYYINDYRIAANVFR